MRNETSSTVFVRDLFPVQQKEVGAVTYVVVDYGVSSNRLSTGTDRRVRSLVPVSSLPKTKEGKDRVSKVLEFHLFTRPVCALVPWMESFSRLPCQSRVRILCPGVTRDTTNTADPLPCIPPQVPTGVED